MPASIPAKRAQYVTYTYYYLLQIIKSISDVRRSYPYSGELGTIFGFLRSAGVSLPALVLLIYDTEKT